jgi:D-serine deaminase-like pyridoxal phosphate-dependent protein
MNKDFIKSPTLLLDEEKCKRNINRMTQKARNHQLVLRPHFKTHQSGIIGAWIKSEGVNCCTVSSVKMARYFADQGWEDILIAFPVNPREHEHINNLANKIKLQILAYDKNALVLLSNHIDGKIGVKIELDIGSKRSGLRPDQDNEIRELLAYIDENPKFHFTGFYSHPGHSYTARGRDQVKNIYSEFMPGLKLLDKKYADVPGFSITIGDTPGCTIVDDFGPIREISPGNFVFYDVMQVNIGSCTYDDIAVVMACPVVGKNLERNELLIHGGAVHFSKEVLTDADGTTHFGKLAKITEDGWKDVVSGCYLKSISQEHGLIHGSDEFMQTAQIGDLVYIYPAHSCLTADLMKSYLTTENKLQSSNSAFMK